MVKTANKIYIDDLLQLLKDCEFSNDTKNIFFDHISQINETEPNSLSWLSPIRKDKASLYGNTKVPILICDKNDIPCNEYNPNIKLHIFYKNPKIIFANILNFAFSEPDDQDKIHPTAIIHPNAKLHPSVKVGAYSIIGDCIIGANTIIKNHVTINTAVEIGNHVVIYEYCSIGSDGFGFAKDDDDRLIKLKHIGKVIIEDEVEIFPHANVDKGTLKKTHIKKGAKIDHYCHIGHNSTIGENSMITANVILCGGASVGSNCMLGVGSIIKEAVNVGDKVTIGLGAVVTKNVPDNETWTGNPARELNEFIKTQQKIKNL